MAADDMPRLESRSDSPAGRRRRFPWRCVALAVNAVFVVLLALELLLTARGADAFGRFEAVPGKVLATDVRQVTEAHFIRRDPRRHLRRSTRVTVSYEFGVAGRRLTGDRVFLLDHPLHADAGVGGSTAAHLLATYRPGDAVTVRYAARSGTSYLEVGWPVVGRVLLGLLPAFLLANGMLALAWIVRRYFHFSSL